MKRLLMSFVVMILLLTACSSGAQNEQAIMNAFSELAPKARAFYAIIYADALAHADEDNGKGYYLISESAEYQSIAAMKAAMQEVFSSDYLTVLYNTAFTGVSVDEGAIESKFIENDGKLYVNPSVTEDFAQPREFDLAGAKVTKSNRYRAIITVQSGDETLEITMSLDNGEWKIDSAAF